MPELLIPQEKSIVISANTDGLLDFFNIVSSTCTVKGIGAYRIDFRLGLNHGLGDVVKAARDYTQLPIIYDHQTADNSPDEGADFAKICRKAKVNGVILSSEAYGIQAAQDAGLKVLVGLGMKDNGTLDHIYTLAAKSGVKEFVVPGNKLKSVSLYRQLLEGVLGGNNFALYSADFMTPTGERSEYAQYAGNRWHAIVQSTPEQHIPGERKAMAQALTSQLGYT